MHGGWWAACGVGTNAPLTYPVGVANSTRFHLLLMPITSLSIPPLAQYEWDLPGEPGAQFFLQTSTDLANWITITTITNSGGNFTYVDRVYGTASRRYFRTLAQ